MSGAFEGMVVERTLGNGPPETITVRQGISVRLVLHAPEGTELHLHGYDLAGTAGAGAPVVMTFHASHVGRFAIEAHGIADALGRSEKALAYVEVRPE
jgi:FtsP/CotA-like multicopper oxidase with cupredoxin domain